MPVCCFARDTPSMLTRRLCFVFLSEIRMAASAAAVVDTKKSTDLVWEGGCHCGKVRWRVRVDPNEQTIVKCKSVPVLFSSPPQMGVAGGLTALRVSVHVCSCSICSKKGFLHLMVPPERFTLLSGEKDITTCKGEPHSQLTRLADFLSH